MNKLKLAQLFLVALLPIICYSASAASTNQSKAAAVDPAFLIFGQDPGDNEFPRTVGTVRREKDGFVAAEWESGNLFGFLDNFTELFDVSLNPAKLFQFFTTTKKEDTIESSKVITTASEQVNKDASSKSTNKAATQSVSTNPKKDKKTVVSKTSVKKENAREESSKEESHDSYKTRTIHEVQLDIKQGNSRTA